MRAAPIAGSIGSTFRSARENLIISRINNFLAVYTLQFFVKFTHCVKVILV